MKGKAAFGFIFIMLVVVLNFGCQAGSAVNDGAADAATATSVVDTDTASAADTQYEKHFDFKLSVEPAEQYKGAVIGSINLIKMEITNLTDRHYEIGDYFRILMTQDESAWSQLALAASGPTRLDAKDVTNLKYGYGSNSIAQKGEERPSIVIHIGNMNSIINDTSPESQQINLEQWWPTLLPPAGTVTITWPTFWFSDSADKPKALASPQFTSKGSAYYCWVDFADNEAREIPADTKSLLGIISNNSEPAGLRAASAAWLLEVDRKNEKHLLTYLQDEKAPDTLAYRAMQALMIWGSPKIIDEVFGLWKERKLLHVVDIDVKHYLTWSKHENAKKYKEQVEANKGLYR